MSRINIRTGFGYDVHRFAEGRKLILGGVEIPFEKGLDGHSDADVLLHSICDAILGAGGFKDIGNQFPDKDIEFKDISSLLLLKRSYELISGNGWQIGNLDCTLVLEKPKIFSHTDQMKKNISGIILTDDISIKATTSEGMGFVGREEGCVAYSTVLLFK
ncbi:MAG: 2-C-methyl-D-erythritol 2,4-cyclodiphosphate synthase [Ignavibacteria bacterium]|nr:2-C-methyl-D-erythritol 2,4-cyclodiphosphate synthase [Ignavibacteria bacterium]